MAALLIDLDGVIYQGERVIPGAPEAARWLAAQEVEHLFVTNTTSRPRTGIVAKLAALGLQVSPQQIFTPPVAAATWLQARGVTRVALFVPDATREEFAAFEQIEETAESGAQAVIVGDLGTGWRFEVLNRAFRLLMQTPAPHLVALGMTRYWRADDGLRLDTAPFVMALAHASGVEQQVLGKPARSFFQAACATLGSPPEDTIMIGDDIQADVAGAQAAGLRGVLVRTGKFRETDLERDVVPSARLGSFAELPEWWSAHAADR